MKRTQERGFILAVVLFGMVALSIAGVTSIMLSSSDMATIGNERRRHQVEACAEAGIDAAIGSLPDTSWASAVPSRPSDPNAVPGNYVNGLYHSGNGMVARIEHYRTTDTSGKVETAGNAASALDPAAMANMLRVGENVTNMQFGGNSGQGAAGMMGSGAYRLVSTCRAPNLPESKEVETVVVYGVGR
jgi:Tfp pilus assembly protein PilX